jgi:hypothetical protein
MENGEKLMANGDQFILNSEQWVKWHDGKC